MRFLSILACVFWLFGEILFAETRLFPKLESNQTSTQQEIKQETSTLDMNGDLPSVDSNATIESKNLQPQVESQSVESQTTFSPNPLVRNVYLEAINPLFSLLYVNQIVALELKMLIFADYTTIKTDFIFEDSAYTGSVEILNPNETWVLNAEDSSLRNTFFLKIKKANYAIPQIKVSVNTSDGEVSESVKGSIGRAIKLERKGSFSQVLAHNLEILDTKITNYDANSNLAVFQLHSTMGNLFDFHLETYAQQGIESKDGDYKQATAFYYVIVPKDSTTISFDYFNTQTSKYQTLQVPNIAKEERVSTQSDIKPKNNYQFFKISLMLFLVLLFFGLYLYKRKWIFVLFALFCLGLLVYFMTLKTSVFLKPGAILTIQPTFNSTVVLVIQDSMEAEILGDRGNYYKVILQDDRIGWVKKDDIQN